MNRRTLIVGAGAVATAGGLSAVALPPPMPPPSPMPNLVMVAMTFPTRVGRHILIGCHCERGDGVIASYMAPGVVRRMTASGREYIWLIATDAPPEHLCWFLDFENGAQEKTSRWA